MSSSTQATTLTTAVTTLSNVTAVNTTSASTIAANTTVVVATEPSNTTTATASDTPTVSSTTQTKAAVAPTSPATGGSIAGPIAGGVVGGLVLVVIVIVMVVMFRRRKQRKARKKGTIPWAPGKDDLDRVQNQYSPQPTTTDSHQPESNYANLTTAGNLNESTDPALDNMGYLKSKTKHQKEAGSELYYETKSEKDVNKKKKKHKKKKAKKDKIYENDKQPVYENKGVHDNEAFEQPSYLDLTDSVDKGNDDQKVKVTGTTNNSFVEDEYVDPDKDKSISVKPKTLVSTPDKNGDRIKPKKAPLYKNEKAKAESNKTVKTKADTDKVPENNDEIDEEYEVPDATNYPEPKKSPARTNVNGTKNHKSDIPKDKDKSKTKEVNGKAERKAKSETGKQRESKYENVKESGRYVNVANSETVEAVTEEYYEVPDNR